MCRRKHGDYRRRTSVVPASLFSLLLLLASPVWGQCAGDCDGDGTVSVDELIRGVNIALGTVAVDQCAPFDTNGSGDVTIDEILVAVNNALQRCEIVVQPAIVLLNEVLYIPGSGEAHFVEVKALGVSSAPLGGLTLVNEIGQTMALPEVSLAGGAVHEITLTGFDFLDPDAGFVELRDGDEMLDRVAWGEEFADGVNLTNGSVMSRPLPEGSSIGRPPGADAANNRIDWAVYYGAPTPGERNPNIAIPALSPRDGARFEGNDVFLRWDLIPGASGYAVLVAPSNDPDTPVLAEMVDEPGVLIESLDDGEYTWTVQPIPQSGVPAPASGPHTFSVGTSPFGARTARGRGPGSEVLLENFEFIRALKDTSMLLLEAEEDFRGLGPTPPMHTWDAPHNHSDLADPADRTHELQASIVMINAYLGGTVSQDRLSYEIFKDRSPGPERDLNYDDLPTLGRVQRMVTYAFGGFTQLCAGDDQNLLWDFVTSALDEDLPVLSLTGGSNLPNPISNPEQRGISPNFVEVIAGYHVSDVRLRGVEPERFVAVYDSGLRNPYAVEFRDFQCFWKPPASAFGVFQEASISLDSDGDGVVDFDETERFGTDPLDPDTDRDGLEDKDEIRDSVFAVFERFDLGLPARGDLRGRDWDGDGVPMELDCDSDNDGVLDLLDLLDPFSRQPGPVFDRCVPLAWEGESLLINKQPRELMELAQPGDLIEEAHASGLVFRPVEGAPGGRYESVSGSLTYRHNSINFEGCPVEGEITLDIPPGDASLEFIGGGVYGARGSTSFEIPVTVRCPEGERSEVRFPSIWLEATGSQEEPYRLQGSNIVFGVFNYEWSFRGAPLVPVEEQ